MQTVAALAASVVSDYTRRPELVSLTEAAVRTAVVRAHSVNFFPQDQVVGQLSYPVSSAVSSYSLEAVGTLLPRYRAIEAVYGVDSSRLPVEQFEYRKFGDLHDASGALRTSVYSIVGNVLRIAPARATGYLDVIYYALPEVTNEGNIYSWLVDLYKDDVVAWAAAIVFNRTGFNDQAANLQRTHVDSFKELLTSSHLTIETN